MGKNPSRQAFLTLGTLIYRQCKKSDDSCYSTASVDAQDFLVDTLHDCDNMDDYKRVEEILITIKAIGNAKQPESARSTLIQCATQTTHSNITIAAFDALRGMTCDEDTLQELLMIIKDNDVGDDKRIHAFRASMKCPTVGNLQQLVDVYNKMTSEQVGMFMWTYLTNLNESNNPENIKTKELLSSITKNTPLKVPETSIYRPASRNFEKSIFIDSIKSGLGAKANLIFNRDEIIPKTAMFDMTAKVMGVPVELVETVVGVDGLDTILENMDIPNALDFNIFKVNLADKK